MINQLSKREILMLKHLINAKKPLSSEVLGVIMGTSPKTIRNSMEIIDEILKLTGGGRISSKTGSGHSVEIYDENEFKVFMQTFNAKYFDDYWIPTNTSSRVSYIIRRLLTANGYIKIESLTEALYVSRVTITKDLKAVRYELGTYHLRLENRPKYGICVKGTEMNLRVALADYMDADEDTGSIEDEDVDLYNGDPKLITDTLAKGLFERGISISTNSLRKLVRIIIVSEFRIRQNKYCDFSQEELTEIESLAEFELAQAIVRDIGFGDWPVSEITALAILILSRRNISRNDPYDIRKERRHFELAGRIIEWIFNRTDVDLTVYPEMRQELAKHLRGMTYRLNYGLEKRDVGILESKGSNPAFEYAIIAAQLLSEKFGKPVQETEIAYLSYRFYKHFQVISSHRRLNVLVILSNGKNTADLFINELMASFSKYIDRVDVIEFYEVPFVRMDPFDCILTDIPEIHFNVLPPVVRVNYFFNENDLLKLRHYFTNSLLNLQLFRNCFRPELFFRDIDARNKESVIRQMVAKAGAVLDLPDDVLTQVLERERISSTECGNSVAIPHTLYACCDQPSVAVGVLKRPIVWEKERCQLVLLVFNGREEYAPFSMLSLTKAATKSIHFVYNLIKAPGFQEVKENIEEFISHYDF